LIGKINTDGYSSLQLRVNVQFGQSFKEAGVDSLEFNVQFCLMVNASASPDLPKPLKQWGALAAAWRTQGCSHEGRIFIQRVNLLKQANIMIPRVVLHKFGVEFNQKFTGDVLNKLGSRFTS
jgi:hypothetical protein